MQDALAGRFIDLVLADPVNRTILARLPNLGIADAWLVAGCLVGPVWNALSGQPPQAHINDYDIFYWDADTSWSAEDRVIAHSDALFADLDIRHDVRNQARVPVWFEERIGSVYPTTLCCAENIGDFIVACTCVGLRPDGAGGFELSRPRASMNCLRAWRGKTPTIRRPTASQQMRQLPERLALTHHRRHPNRRDPRPKPS